MPTKIRKLKEKAIKQCEEVQGHVMKQFYFLPYMKTFYSNCIRCGKNLEVNTDAYSNLRFEIYEEAVSNKCDAPWHSDFVSLASLWYNGQWSAMYKFLCNHGKVFNKEHADDLIKEIEDCMYFTRKPMDIEELKLFRQYVREKKILCKS